MQTLPSFLCSLVLGTLFFATEIVISEDTAAEEKWVSLFNGKDPRKTFRVEDGLLKVGYENYEEFNETFGHLFYETPYSNYRLRLEYRFTGEQFKGGPGWVYRNSGIMIHGQNSETMVPDQDFSGAMARANAPLAIFAHPVPSFSSMMSCLSHTAHSPSPKPTMDSNGLLPKLKYEDTKSFDISSTAKLSWNTTDQFSTGSMPKRAN